MKSLSMMQKYWARAVWKWANTMRHDEGCK